MKRLKVCFDLFTLHTHSVLLVYMCPLYTSERERERDATLSICINVLELVHKLSRAASIISSAFLNDGVRLRRFLNTENHKYWHDRLDVNNLKFTARLTEGRSSSVALLSSPPLVFPLVETQRSPLWSKRQLQHMWGSFGKRSSKQELLDKTQACVENHQLLSVMMKTSLT